MTGYLIESLLPAGAAVGRYPRYGPSVDWTPATGSAGKEPIKVPFPDLSDEFSEYEMYGVPDWDGYGASRITLDTVRAARNFKRLLPREVPPPDVAPGADGTIGFEWRSGSPSWSFTLVDVGPGDLITARQVLEDGNVIKFLPTRLEDASPLIRQLFSL